MDFTRQKVALISVYEKKNPDIAGFAQALVGLGWKIISSGGTARYLTENGIAVQDVAELVGGGAILGHRVVTLSREVHAGLLARDCKEDQAELDSLGIPRIDLVCCDFYPLSAEIAKPGASIDSVIEQTDIGGPTMVRSAAKGGRIVICDPSDRELVLGQLQLSGEVCEETRQYLRAKAEFIVANYCLESARFHSEGDFDGVLGRKCIELAYGENRDQSPAAMFSTGSNYPLSWRNWHLVSGVPGYINMADGNRTLELMCLMAESFRQNFGGQVPYIAIACKHGNPCGAAIDWSNPLIAIYKAMFGDSDAVMGAELMVNFSIDLKLALAILKVVPEAQRMFHRVNRENWGVDVVFAPDFSADAANILGQRESRRLLSNPALANPVMPPNQWVYRPTIDGFIRQAAPNFVFNQDGIQEWAGLKKTSRDFLSNLIVAWAVAWRANSNTVVLAKDGMLIGPGVGQQDRRMCCKLALERAKTAGHDVKGAVFASDAFFPFAKRPSVTKPFEGIELLARAGCIGGVVPADGKRLEEVKRFIAESGMTVAFLPKEHRGFSQH